MVGKGDQKAGSKTGATAMKKGGQDGLKGAEPKKKDKPVAAPPAAADSGDEKKSADELALREAALMKRLEEVEAREKLVAGLDKDKEVA